MDQSDKFGLMSHNQFSKGNLTNRVLIGDDKNSSWLTVPVSVSMGDKISEVKIAKNFRPNKVKNTLYHTYSRTKYWSKYGDLIISYFENVSEGDLLVDLNLSLIYAMIDFLQIEVEAEVVNPKKNLNASENLAMWAKMAGASTYLSGTGGKNYLDEKAFSSSGIGVDYFENSNFGNFSTVSIVSCLMNMGEDWRKAIQL